MPAIANTSINFCGIAFGKVHLGAKLPLPKYKSRIKEHFMSEGEGGAGIRVIEPLGVHMSYTDYPLTIELVTASQANTLLTAYFDQPTPKVLTIYTSLADGTAGPTYTYNVLFDADGLDIDFQDDWMEFYDEYPYKAVCNLKILTRSS